MIVCRALGGRELAPSCSQVLQAREELLWLPARCAVIISQRGGTHQHYLQSAFLKYSHSFIGKFLFRETPT